MEGAGAIQRTSGGGVGRRATELPPCRLSVLFRGLHNSLPHSSDIPPEGVGGSHGVAEAQRGLCNVFGASDGQKDGQGLDPHSATLRTMKLHTQNGPQ